MSKRRPALFKWRHFEPDVIVCSIRWYLRFSLSYRDVEELLMERGLSADHTTVWRWVQRYAPELNQRCRGNIYMRTGSVLLCMILHGALNSGAAHWFGPMTEGASLAFGIWMAVLWIAAIPVILALR